MQMNSDQWRSIDTVEKNGDLYVLQQRYYVETNHRGTRTEPGSNHRLQPIEKVV